MDKQPIPLKRWTVIDTLNLCVMIAAFLFIIDFKNNAVLSYAVIAAFVLWIIAVIVKNIYISKQEKNQREG